MNSYNLYDRLISATFYREIGNDITAINIPAEYMGYKPAINLRVTMIPDNICFQMTVTLTNAAIVKNTDIRTFLYMSITAGYRGFQKTFTGPIFSSYIAKPNPDGEVVFEGIAVGTVGLDLFKQRPYRVQFHSAATVLDVVEAVADGIGVHYNVDNVESQLLYTKLDFPQSTKTAENAYAVLNWLQQMLNNYCQWAKENNSAEWMQRLGNPYLLYVFFEDDTIYLKQTNKPVNAGSLLGGKNFVDLSLIKNAAFSGPALTVSAPYNPRVSPGEIIHMDPVYFRGGTGLLNIMEKSIFNPDEGFYRVLKMDVNFSSVGSTNEMSIMALPITAYTLPESTSDVMQTVEQIAEQERKRMTDDTGDMVKVASIVSGAVVPDDVDISEGTIVIGTRTPAPGAGDVESAPPKDMWSVTYTPPPFLTVRVEDGQTLSQIAKETYGSDLFYLDNEHMSEEFNRAMPNGVPLWYFFPIIMVATYKAMKIPVTGSAYYINPNNPDSLRAGKAIAIPPLSSVSEAKLLIGNQPVIQIFQAAEEYYRNLNLGQWAAALHDIYMYLSKGRP